MRIQVKGRFAKIGSVSIAEAVEHKLTPDGYSYQGQVEYIGERAVQTAKFMGMLLEMLAERGLLEHDAVIELLGKSEYEKVI